ncbi:TPA: hypothetical protein NV473_004164 [Citrobacter freundii]|uniref:Uncharacterized protein n=1 Tax=Citrobacter portucalensis TaxID=1639133 RepID=A0ABD5H4K6_9ENTR|nr:hypothetical protein [Citrobacter portucalensis]MDW2636016.1 hypothetical protein [Citrobacter portucalensis]HCJ7746011.1 hypothetical protein [Citrobacter freundii]
MTSKLTALSRWLNDQEWTTGSEFSRKRFYSCVKTVLNADPGYTITSQDVEDYIINEFRNHSDLTLVASLAKVAAIEFGAIQAFCKANALSV